MNEQTNINGKDKILNTEIEKEVKRSFIEYAMSVIIDRALPDVRDGLKPVHRRILYAMHQDGLTYNKPFRKSATTVGNVLGHYHPHGDASVYDAMVRLAQPFSLRYPLVEGHGNFGNVDGDGAAAYRYTEARMARISEEMLSDIEKNVVEFMPNFDNKLKEPTVLPARFPNILVNGSIGIAVGMATNIPPHNLTEVIDGTIHLIDHPEAELADLLQFIKGPDFPTYGQIYGTAGIHEAYATGKGKVMVRAKATFEEHNGKTSIVFTEIPYMVNKSALVASIADLVKEKRVEGITGLRDESGRAGMRIVVDVRRDVNANILLNQLYKYTQLQDTCAMNMLALVNGEPKVLTLKQILQHYIRHQLNVVENRLRFDLDKAKKRAHIVEGLMIAINNIDEVISIIRASKTIQDAKEKLIERFEITEIQSQEIVQMPLGRLSGLEIEKLVEELEALHAKIDEIEGILADEAKVCEIVKTELLEVRRRYGDERRTEIIPVENEILMEDLIEREDCVITISHAGYVKRMPADTYTAQRRGGKGIIAMHTKEEDFVENVFIAHSHNYLMMFSNLGKVFIKKCYEIPESSKGSKGTNLVNVIELSPDEKITAYISVEEFAESEYLTMITKHGVIKRTLLTEYKNARRNGLIAINLDEGDELLYVLKTDGEHHLTIATHDGQAVHFSEEKARTIGRTARGVKAIELADGDWVVGATATKPDDGKQILSITENGFGKRTVQSEFPLHNRGGKGVICHNVNGKYGKLCGIAAVSEDEDVMLITDSGTIIRTKIASINTYSRSAGGVTVMRVAEGTTIVGFTAVAPEEEKDEETDSVENTDSENTAAAEETAAPQE
ncbi:MAG: DNA gyrase subunit A [Ruminococcaceae bacterium]|nr:DNA gyrase subunit A [Oscillospiraceae bacterium]